MPGGVKCRDAIREGFQRPLREENTRLLLLLEAEGLPRDMEHAIAERDDARAENTRLVAEVESLKANIAKAEIAAEGCWLDAKDAAPVDGRYAGRCRNGHKSMVACLLAAVKAYGRANRTSDKAAIRQPGGAQ